MKKKLFRIWLLAIVVSWLLCFVVQFLLCEYFNNEFNWLERILNSAILSFLASFAVIINVINVFPRANYLERDDVAKPPFIDVCSSEVNTLQVLDFNRLKTKIGDKWVITFSDEDENVLKFREKMGLFKKWGAAAWMKYNSETNKIYLECFTMTGHRHELARKMEKEVLKCLKDL